MYELIKAIKKESQIAIKNSTFLVKTKTWYSLEEDNNALYIKCELSKNKVLVIIPEDNLIYVGQVIKDLQYKRISNNRIEYKGIIFDKTGDGHQVIKNIEFGLESEIEGKCSFEDYESDNNIISLGVLTDKNNIRADVLATIISLNDLKIKDRIIR